MIISFFNPSDLIGCGGDINQSDSFRYAEGVRTGGTRRGYAEGVCRGGTRRGYAEGVRGWGTRRGTQRGYTEGVSGGGTRRGYMCSTAIEGGPFLLISRQI